MSNFIRLRREENAGFQTGVSLHSHTSVSQEPITFLARFADASCIGAGIVRTLQTLLRQRFGGYFQLDRVYWTPPLTPGAAWRLEDEALRARGQNALVSLTDHDDIAGTSLLRAQGAGVPVSVEWTVPWGPTFFHLGVHNLLPKGANSVMNAFRAFTLTPSAKELRGILSELAVNPSTLIVFNHPLWDEKGIGTRAHIDAACEFLRQHRECIHAVEFNGLRPLKENQLSATLAKEVGLPVVSGGDRHGTDPNTVLNVTNAKTFDEFANEVRGGFSTVAITDRYRQPLSYRIARDVIDAFRSYQCSERGLSRWDQRVFYTCDDGVARSLAELVPTSSVLHQLEQSGIKVPDLG